MRNLLFSVFAIGVAAVAAMTATTALLNAPHRNAPAAVATASSETPSTQPSQLAVEGQATPPPAGNTSTPTAPSDGAKPAAGAANGEPAANGDEEVDKDPYEGIPQEELPPDLQYSADSSVSFPTNI
jgi:hypothetical protein